MKCEIACISEQLLGLLNNAFFKCHKRVNKSVLLYRNYIYSNFILKISARLTYPIGIIARIHKREHKSYVVILFETLL